MNKPKRAGFKVSPIADSALVAAEAAAQESELVASKRAEEPATAGQGTKPQHHLAALQDAPATASEQGTGRVLAAPQDRKQFTVGMLLDVPLHEIRSNPMNPRVVYTAAVVDEMAMSMQQHGQRVAAQAFIDDDGAFVLIEGETRLRGARTAGLATLRLEIRPKPTSDRELYEEARAANVERHKPSPLDDALRWKDLLAKGVYPSQVALAEGVGVHDSKVSRILALAQLPSRIINHISEYPDLLNMGMLYSLYQFWEQQGEDETIELIRKIGTEGFGYREVDARRVKAAAGRVLRPRSTASEISFKGRKGKIKTFEKGGRLELSLKGLSAEEAADLAEKIKALFPD